MNVRQWSMRNELSPFEQGTPIHPAKAYETYSLRTIFRQRENPAV